MNTILGRLLAPHNTEYLVVDRDLLILETSLAIQQFAARPDEVILGKDVRLGFPELIGVEDYLIDILQGRQRCFELKGIARFKKHSSTLYIDLSVINIEDWLIILLQDATERMVLQQTLVQKIHEATILLNAFSASQQYLNKIITSMADALLVTTASGDIKTVNKAALDLFGYSEGELIGKPISIIIADEKIFSQVNQGHPLSSDEFLKDYSVVCQTKTGKELTIAFRGAVIQTECDDLQDFVYIGRDITEHLLSEQLRGVEHATTRILSESATLDEATPKILEAICSNLGWELGELWSVDQQANVLRIVESWHVPSLNLAEFELGTRQIAFSPGVGLPGRVWVGGKPAWIEDVVHDPGFKRKAIAASSGLHGAFGFPILDGGRILGVMTFFSRKIHQPQSDLLNMMAAIGSQIGQFIRRKIAEEQIKLSLQEKEILLKEVHHRVKNNLQIISGLLYLQSRYVEDKKTLQVLQENRDRIQSMALLHEKLYGAENFTQINFRDYISNLLCNLFISYGVNTDIIAWTLNIEPVSLEIDTAIHCGLIVNELVSNSLKHAFPQGCKGEIAIEFYSTGEKSFELIVRDNGVGFTGELDFRNKKSLGLRLVYSLATQQLEGTIEADGSQGAQFKIGINTEN